MAGPRTALVTGASRGLGLAITRELLAHDWDVVAAVRTPESFTSPVVERCRVMKLDLLDADLIPASIVDALAAAAGLRSGRIDAVVHNAGVTAYGAFEDTPVDVWQDVFQTNVFGPMFITRCLLPHLREGGGHVLIVSSEAAMHGFPAVGIYAASKAAVSRWAESLAHEVGPLGVRVSILEPGAHATDITTDYPQHRDDAGPYAAMYPRLDRLTDIGRRIARPPERFARRVVATLESAHPPRRRSSGPEAWAINVGTRLLPSRWFAAAIDAATRRVDDRPNWDFRRS